MASSKKGLRIGIQVALGIVIIVLAYVLYESITNPYEEIERRQRVTQRTRARMDDVRQALILYEREEGRFPGTLDSLTMYIQQNPFVQANTDSLFGTGFNLDSLIYSPRTGESFEYSVNDTGRVDIYLLVDPATGDQIGSAEPDVTQLNAASWE